MPTASPSSSIVPQQFDTDQSAVIAFIRSQSAHHKQTIASPGLRGRTNGLLLKALSGKDIRVDYLRHLFGIDSSRDLTNAMCFAVEWLLTTGSEAEKREIDVANGGDGDGAVDNVAHSVDNHIYSVDNEATRRGEASMILARAKHSPQPPLDNSNTQTPRGKNKAVKDINPLVFSPESTFDLPLSDDDSMELIDPFAPSHEETINRQPFSPKALEWLKSFKNSLDSEQGALWSE